MCAHLGGQEKARKRGAVDSRELVQDRQRGQDPVAFIDLFSRDMQRQCSHWSTTDSPAQKACRQTDIFQHFGVPVQATVGKLPLSEPLPKRRRVYPSNNRSRIAMHTHTAQKKEKEGRGDTNTPRTAWLTAPATHPKPPSKVGARGEVGDRAVVVEAVESLERGHGAV